MGRLLTIVAILGGIASVVGLALSLYLLFRPSSGTALELQTTSSLALTSSSGPFSERIQVTLDGQPVREIWLATFRLVNAADTDIGVGDFGGRIHFSQAQTSIQDVIPGDSDPPGLQFQLSKPQDSTFYLEPLLLKKREAISFSVLSTSKLESLVVGARIKNVDEVKVRLLPQGAVVVKAGLRRLLLYFGSGMAVAFYLLVVLGKIRGTDPIWVMLKKALNQKMVKM